MKSYRAVVQVLKKHCPTDLPVKVRRMKIPNDRFGDCDKGDGHYIIRISKALKEQQAIFILLHEWSHALCWNKCIANNHKDDDHCDYWGKAYSKVYRVYLKKYIES
jgi:hypothetical protein